MKDEKKTINKKKLIAIIASIFGVISITFWIFYFLILDLNPFPYTDQNLTNPQVFNRQIVRSLTKVETSKTLNFEIDQDSLNQLLINASKEKEDNFGDFYVDIKENNYYFYADIDLKIVRSKVCLETTLINGDENFIFDINNVKLGKLSWWSMLNKTPIEDTFKNVGLNIKLENNRIVYPKENVRNDLTNIININNQDLASLVINNADLKTNENPFAISGDLNLLIENNEISDCSLSGPHYANYETTKYAIETTTQNIKNVLSQRDEIIKDTANTQFGSLKELYPKGEGINLIVKKEIQTLPTNPSSYVGTTKVASVNETQVNELLQSSDILGKNSIFYYNNELSYIVVDRLYSDIFMTETSGKFINYTLGLNVNGLETRVIIETVSSPFVNEFSADFTITNIYYGTKEVDETSKNIIKDMFKVVVDSVNDSWITYNKDADKVTFDFSKLIKDDPELTIYKDIFYEGGGTRSFAISNTKVNEVGEFALYYDL